MFECATNGTNGFIDAELEIDIEYTICYKWWGFANCYKRRNLNNGQDR